MSTAAVRPNHVSSPCSSVDSMLSVVNLSTHLSHISHAPHTPHAPHPVPLREHAFTLHCQGLRSPAISQELGVPERTVRAWIAAALADLKDDLQLNRKEQLLLAVVRQNQLTASAWQQFEAEAAARDALLDAALNTLRSAAHATDVSARSVTVRLPASTPAPRYLSLILQANKEINRLLGLHTLARLDLLTPDVPDTEPILPSDADLPAESATDSISPFGGDVGALPAAPARAEGDIQNPAKAATASDSPLPPGEGSGVGSSAKTATATESGLAAGLQPANPHPTILSPSLARSADPAVPAQTATGIAAASATAAGSPPRVREGLGVRSAAKTATAAPKRKTPKPWMM